MRKLKKWVSGLLAAAVMATGFGGVVPFTSVGASGTEADGQEEERLVIFDANPLNLNLRDGDSAAHGDFTWNGWNESTGTSAVKLEESTPYFRVTVKDNTYKGLATINTGMRNAELCRTHGWFVVPEILETLKPYIQVEFDVRWNGSSLDGEKLYIIPAVISDNSSMHDIGEGEAAALVNGMDMGDIPANQWKSISLPVDAFPAEAWGTGALAIGVWNGSGDALTAPIELDIRRFRLTVSPADEEAIHNALKAIPGIDDIQWFTDDWEPGGEDNTKLGLAKEPDGTVNYFTLLTLYNADSDYRAKPAEEPRDLVIWDADPEKVSKTDGASARPEWTIRPDDKPGDTWDYHWSSAPKSTGTSVVKYDQDIPYYSCTFTGQWDGGGAILENGFNNRLADANMGWLEKREILTAIKDYLVIAYDVYVEGDTGDYTHINFEPVAEWSDKGPWDEYGNLAGVDVYEANTWVSHTKKGMETYREDGTHHWCCGDILVTVARGEEGQEVSADSPLTVHVRRLRISLNEADKEAINAKLAAVEGIDDVNYFTRDKELPKDDEGNTDYFALLTAYDAQSNYSTGRASYILHDATDADAHGSVQLPGSTAREGDTVHIAASPDNGWKTAGLAVSLANDQKVEVTRTAPNGFSFVMPAEDVTVEATFVQAPTNDDSYVFWEANPDKASPTQTNGASVEEIRKSDPNGLPTWSNPTGTGTLQFDEDVPYYRAEITKNDSNGFIPFPTFLFSGTLGWSGNADVMKALTAYAYIEFDVRRTGAEGSDPQLYMGPATEGNGIAGTSSSSGTFVNGYTLDSDDIGEWVTVRQDAESFYTNGNWWNGDFGLAVWGEGDNAVTEEDPITVDIRNLRMMVKESDRLALNETLSQIPGIDTVKFFTADWEGNPLEIGTDSAGNKDYFSLLQAFDAKSPYSSHYEPHAVTVEEAANGSAVSSKTEAKKNVVVKISAEPADGYRLSQVAVMDSQNNRISTTRVDETHVVFTMPDDAVTVTPVFVKQTDKMQVLFYAESVSANKDPQFSGETTLSYDGQGSAWDFKVTSNEGLITIYGLTNTFVSQQLPEEAEITFRAKLTLADGSTSRQVTLGAEGSDKTKVITVGADWTEFTISAREIADNLPSALTFSLAERQVGDVLSISEIQIWSKSAPGKTIQERFEMAFDMSDYPVRDTNEEIGIIGDPDGDVTPWEPIYNNERPSMLGWNLAWFAQFRGESPWYISPNKENMGKDYYQLDFYHPKDQTLTQGDMTSYLEEGYLEFFIKADEDGLTVPIVVTSTPADGSEFNVPFRVTYDASQARPDGYMRVRIPLTYLAAMGLPLDSIRWIHIQGIQPIESGFYLSAFTFFSNVAVDQPEPEPEPEPEPPTDFPFHLDTSLVNAVFDFEQMTLTVEENTPIWELLSGLIFDEENVGVLFFDADGSPITDDSVVLAEGMTMIVQRDSYDLGEYDILVVEAGTIVVPDTGVAAHALPAVLLGVSGTLLAVTAKRKKNGKKQLHKV